MDNLINPVLFNRALKQIPKNAVIIEIAPHHLLQSIIKRSFGLNITYIPLMKKNSDNLKLLLTSIGKLYNLGFNPSIEKLYPKVVYPVSNGTLMISPLIQWDHEKDYTVTKWPEFYNEFHNKTKSISIDLMVI